MTPPTTGRTIELRDRRIWLDGEPRLFLGGEVHYFRLARSLWRERLQQLKDCGCNMVATYVPWLWHELADGTVDLTGRTHEQRDLAGFIDLAAEMDLYVVARPGPFIMAEIKNEGVPYRVYDPPGVLPTTWNGATIPTRTADYLSPAFLDAARGWYAEVMPLIAERLLPDAASPSHPMRNAIREGAPHKQQPGDGLTRVADPGSDGRTANWIGGVHRGSEASDAISCRRACLDDEQSTDGGHVPAALGRDLGAEPRLAIVSGHHRLEIGQTTINR